ncbi:DNA modification methylase [Leucobacter triazinivorans]|uniref:DNA modification methylase n=1 Tax=Leucobacter triazinivorans TaxID=1784719 RepID=A0A4P6KGG2_9MICO|nr:DNA modification methylase [Leucobacter triazinivorans]QBE48564.1 DNA modification methylase [Leucobacter triazinivorans]
MKIRIASSVALAAALALGATGCSLIAPQGTLKPYAPSDGVDVTVESVDVRNILLIADETGDSFNVVFGAVNRTGETQDLAINFMGEGSQQDRAEFTVPTGNTLFGDPDGDESPVLVSLPGLEPGATISAYFQVPGASEVEYEVPVLDGTLEEYRRYVLPAGFSQADDSPAAEELAEADEAASQSKIGDDIESDEAGN